LEARGIIRGHPNIETAHAAQALVVAEPSRKLSASAADFAYQDAILPGVSRTFALTIPVLPHDLAIVMTNAYLLCRLADTIEDDVGLDNEQKSRFHARFVAVVKGEQSAEAFAADLYPLLSSRSLPAERDLVKNTAAVIRVMHGFSDAERGALTRCVAIMCSGMPEFQRNKSLEGLRDLDELARYCYYVAGVVGEMCTELFCLHCPELAPRRERMLKLALSFGQGLQMTNILKDIWDDRHANACWLPRSEFAPGFDLARLEDLHASDEFREGLERLVGIAHAHLRNALEYTCLIPKRERGIRRFCLWALGLAVLTLRNLHANPKFRSGAEVKVSRRTVKATVLATNLTLLSNRALKLIFARAADGLPLATEALAVADAREPGWLDRRIDVV
jgi:farnesyl-diphosphate farnesyltransferase